ncbi:hypothetical protein FEM48_Zijuj09G0223900 [Ziziphus jujuba var. spinosa]|uniref:Uncharacterized protein n=1 Tax=Ziziphus jujuba var. spinosa TaxID=714518 RepID=A0A978UVN5_ZIZJJ|nr:hypothetical protein FEM48_Zijuj09G0223900 [Ziziphus jujuba var. spinosa]
MINSLCGSMSIKSESSCTNKIQPETSSNESNSISEPKKKFSSSQCSDIMDQQQSSLTPPSLNFPTLKFDLDGDLEVQSPDNSSLWESLFSDQFDSDFMILSPVRNLPSPRQTSNYNYNNNYNYAQSMQGQSLLGCSPPRFGSQVGAAFSSRGKGLSPLHRVFNSPNNNNGSSSNQYMQHTDTFALQAIEDFLDDYQRDGFVVGGFNKMTGMAGGGGNSSSEQSYDLPTPPTLDCLAIPNSSSSSRFCGSASETSSGPGGSQVTQEGGGYQMGTIGPGAPLSEQLRQERREDNNNNNNISNNNNNNNINVNIHRPQQQQSQPPVQLHHNLNHSLMAPLPIASDQEQDSGLQLVHLLLACAEAVAKEDYMLARRYLHHLNRVVTPIGDSMQRVAACFADALSARLTATLTTNPVTASTPSFPSSSLEVLKIYQIVYQACPYVKFAHFTANQAIFEAFEAEDRVHVIDLDILQGYQWPAFMQALAARPTGAPFLRITGVGPSIDTVRETGRCLTELAHSLHVPFEFHAVGEELEDLKPHMFYRRVGEALAVNSVNRLHRVPGNCLGNLLTMIRDQAPNIVTLVEQEASHNGPYFLGRFLEALHYYSAIFDSLDATFPPDSAQRAKVEQYIFAPEIRNIVACEGAERIQRHERLEKWRKVMEGKGFKGVALSANAVTQSKILLGLYSCEGYRLTEDKGCLLLGWQDRPLIAASAWRC